MPFQPVLLAQALGLSCLLGLALACSPEGMIGMPNAQDIVGKVYYSHAVVSGRVILITPTPMLSPSSYTVRLQVSASFLLQTHLGI